MSKIIFTESRMLLDNSVVKAGDERDFGDAENTAFVQNGVAKLVVSPASAVEAPAISPEAAAAAQVATIESSLESAIENKIHLQEVKVNV